MPDAKWLNETNVKAALQDTSLEIETVDRALVRRYTQMFRFGQFERPYEPGEIDAQAPRRRRPHHRLADRGPAQERRRRCCRWTPTPVRSSSSASPTFVDDACLGGGGSSKVTPLYTVPPLEGMQDVLRDLGSSATVTKVTVARRPVQPGRGRAGGRGTPTWWCSWPAWWRPRAPTRRTPTCSTTRTGCWTTCWPSTRPRSWC